MSEHKVALSKGVKMEPQEILKRPYARVLTPEPDGQYTAEVMEFPGCVAYGNTAAEALAKLDEVALEWLAASIEQGQSIPEPFSAIEYSGKLVVRMPRGLHQRAALCAEREGVSLNQFIVVCLAEAVGERARAVKHALRTWSEPVHQSQSTARLWFTHVLNCTAVAHSGTYAANIAHASSDTVAVTSAIVKKDHVWGEMERKSGKVHARG